MKVYNTNLRKYIFLSEGETICKKCNGKGRVPLRVGITLECSECLGEGKIDWIEKITTKKRIKVIETGINQP